MIRILRAFAWLRLRLVVNALRARKSRDGLERASRVGAIVMPIVAATVLLPFALILAVFGCVGGFAMGRYGGEPGFLSAARIFLLVSTFVVLIGPIFRSIHGTDANLLRLLLLPIPRRILHLSEVAAGIADPWILLIAPAILLAPVGFFAASSVAAGVIALLAGGAFLAVLLLLASVSAFLVQYLFRDRRRGEILTFVALAVLSTAGFVPMLLQRAVSSSSQPLRTAVRDTGRATGFSRWTGGLPSELCARSLGLAADGAFARALLPVGALLLMASLAYAVSFAIYRTLLDSPGQGSARRKARAVRIVGPSVPGLSSAASAVAWVQVRGVLRTVIGKMVVFLNPFVLALMAFLVPRMTSPHAGLEDSPLGGGILIVSVGTLFTFVSLGRVLLNQFALDRAGLTLAFLAPVSDRDLIVGKIAGGAVLAALPLGVYVVLSFALARDTDPLLVLCVLLGGLSAYVLFAPLAAICAAVFPKPADLAKMGRGSNPHAAAGFIGFFLSMGLLALPAGLIAAGVLLGGSRLLALALSAAWAALAAILAVPLVGLAASALGARRENLSMVAQGR